jgi:cysteine-rich repeat protein
VRTSLVVALACCSATASAGPAVRDAIAVAAPAAVQDPDLAERAARAYVTAHGELGVRAEDLRVVANRLDGSVRTVGFAQTWHGAPVIGGQIGFVFAHDRLFAVIPHVIGSVKVAGDVRGHSILRTANGDRLVEVEERAEASIYRDATTGDVVERRSKRSDGTSTLEYDVGARYATGARLDQTAMAAAITVDGLATTTGSDGSFAWTGSSSASVVTGVTGSFVRIVTWAGTLATATLTAQPGQPTVWSLASDEHGDAQLSAFIYAGLAKSHARTVNPAVASWLDTALTVNVNEPSSCNAYATADDVHFFVASSVCQNTARVADLVFHEFGHVLHHHSLIDGAGMFEQQLSEGLADWFAADLNDDTGIGRGLYYDDVPVRDIDPYGYERRWPDDVDVDPHVTGLIESGALWDLRKALVRDLGATAGIAQAEAIFTGIMQRAIDIPSSYIAALIADDDDGNLANGTPHFCAIEHAFGLHGLAGPDFATTQISSPAINATAISLHVTTPSGQSCPSPQVVSITVAWRVGDDTPTTFALGSQDGAVWTGAFPPQRDGTVVQYHIDAALDDGSHIVLPDNPADPDYQHLFGTIVPIACEMMDHDPRWVQTGSHGDEWEWAQPGYPTSPDPRAAYTGTNVLGMDVSHNGGRYQPDAVTTITTPAIDISGFATVYLQYARWLTVEDSTYDRADLGINGQLVWENARSRTGTFDHVDKEWRVHDVDLTPFVASGAVQITWSLASDSTNQFGGWILDDVCVVGIAKTPVCGDGVVDPGEQCDDGNTNDGDGCDASCQYEIHAGGGGCGAGGQPPGWLACLLVAYGVRRTCRKYSVGHVHPPVR